jgi:hypothetical protein
MRESRRHASRCGNFSALRGTTAGTFGATWFGLKGRLSTGDYWGEVLLELGVVVVSVLVFFLVLRCFLAFLLVAVLVESLLPVVPELALPVVAELVLPEPPGTAVLEPVVPD